MASKLVAKLKSALGERLTVQGPEVAWPLLCSLELPDGRLDTALYLAGVGPSGRPDRPFERRIQNPSGDTPIVDNPGRVSILLGIHDGVTEPVVLVAWDASRRRNRTTRYSAFVHEHDLMTARTSGTASRTSTSPAAR